MRSSIGAHAQPVLAARMQ
jgi:hypothetical protein